MPLFGGILRTPVFREDYYFFPVLRCSCFTYKKFEVEKMCKHTHAFVENYKGFVGFGLDRQSDENTLIYCLQKFSDDRLMEKLVKRLTDDELEEIFNMISSLMRKYLSEPEYHELFLKDNHPYKGFTIRKGAIPVRVNVISNDAGCGQEG